MRTYESHAAKKCDYLVHDQMGEFGTIRLEMELTMRLTLAEPGAKSFFEIFLLFLSYQDSDYGRLTLLDSNLVNVIHM